MLNKDLFEVIASIVTAATLPLGFYFLKAQFKHQEVLNEKSNTTQRSMASAELLADFVQTYDSLEYRKNRKAYAKKLSLHLSRRRFIKVTDHTMVGTFFENLAFVVNCGALDKEMAFNMFGWSCWNFYTILSKKIGDSSYLDNERKLLSNTYCEIENFAKSYAMRHPEIDVVAANKEYLRCENCLDLTT